MGKKKEPNPDKVLERFMKEHFPYAFFKKIKFFDKQIRFDYKAQAARVCDFFGYKSVYEYGSKEIRCHLTYGGSDMCGLGSERSMHVDDSGKLQEEPFITIIPSIYE